MPDLAKVLGNELRYDHSFYKDSDPPEELTFSLVIRGARLHSTSDAQRKSVELYVDGIILNMVRGVRSRLK